MRTPDIEALPATLDTRQAARLIGCSPDTLWSLVREGKPPVEPLHLGRALRFPTMKVLECLGIPAAAIVVVDAAEGPRLRVVASDAADLPEAQLMAAGGCLREARPA